MKLSRRNFLKLLPVATGSVVATTLPPAPQPEILEQTKYQVGVDVASGKDETRVLVTRQIEAGSGYFRNISLYKPGYPARNELNNALTLLARKENA